MPVLLANAAALTSPLVLVLLIAAVVLLGVRATIGIWEIPLTRLAAWILDSSVAFSILLYLAFVVVRFRIIG